VTEDEEDKLYAEVGRQRLQAYLESNRHTIDTFKMAVFLNWTPQQTEHYIKTGEMPEELLKRSPSARGNNVD
jgi:hypothetical protein